MRVNVDEKMLSDPRFKKLGQRLRITHFEVFGRVLPVWNMAYHRRDPLMAADDVDALAELEGFAAAMVAADLATETETGHLRLRGVEGHIEWLLGQDHKRELARDARRKKLRDFPRETPRDVPDQEQDLSLSGSSLPLPPELPDPRAQVGEISSTPIPTSAAAVLHAAAPPPLVPSGSPRDHQRRRLHAKAWQFAAEEHRKLKAAGVDPHARNCWSGNPAGDDAKLLFARIDELTAGDEPDWETALEAIQNRVLVAAVRAQHELGHLSYFTPARLWDASSFAIDGALSPQQALQLARAKRAKSTGAAAAPTLRIASSDDDAPPPLRGTGGTKP